MPLSLEQQQAVDASLNMNRGEVLAIEACAGSGKTSTLAEIARHNLHKKFLYLAFNKAVVEDARRKFPPNVKIFTTHALAYRWYIYAYGENAVRNIVPSYNIFTIQELFADKENYELAKILNGFKAFCMSRQKEPPSYEIAKIIEAVKQGKLPLTHDYYLKAYQREYAQKFKNHDCILLDEAQDTNEVTLDIFLDNPCAKIIVGDPHQSIYGFRGACNALSLVRHDHKVSLTHSFRSTQPILDRANYFIKKYSKDRGRFKPMVSAVPLEGKEGADDFACIFRTNAGLIRALSCIGDKSLKECGLTRPAHSIFAQPLSILHLINRQYDKIDPQYRFLTRFKNLTQLKQYAQENNDIDIEQGIKLVEDFDSELELLSQKAAALEKNPSPMQIYTTAHTAKGLEWSFVELGSDFMELGLRTKEANRGRFGKERGKNDRMSFKEERGKNDRMSFKEERGKNDRMSFKEERVKSLSVLEFEQELNLYYVAITRARRELCDNSDNDKEYSLYAARGKNDASKSPVQKCGD